MSKNAPHTPRAAQQADKDIGLRIRARRIELKISQEELGQTVGVSFQQIQKYEKGTNRITQSRFSAIAAVLQIAPTELLGPPTDMPPTLVSAGLKFLATPEGAKIARAWEIITDDGMRSAICSFVVKLAALGAQQPEGNDNDGEPAVARLLQAAE